MKNLNLEELSVSEINSITGGENGWFTLGQAAGFVYKNTVRFIFNQTQCGGQPYWNYGY